MKKSKMKFIISLFLILITSLYAYVNKNNIHEEKIRNAVKDIYGIYEN